MNRVKFCSCFSSPLVKDYELFAVILRLKKNFIINLIIRMNYLYNETLMFLVNFFKTCTFCLNLSYFGNVLTSKSVL